MHPIFAFQSPGTPLPDFFAIWATCAIHWHEVPSLVCRRELCKADRANQGGSNRVGKCGWPYREDRPQMESSPPGETAETPPKKNRDKPSSHHQLDWLWK